jgi:hypothetical protein
VSRNRSVGALTVLAWLNVGLHVAALAVAAVGMAPGSPLAPLPERLKYLAAAPPGWTLGWASWMGCAVLLVAFLVAVSRRLGDGADLARLGVTIAVVGAAFDLFCDTVYIVVQPTLAAGRPESLFLTVERLTGIGSLVIANGAYSIAVALVSVALRHRPGVGPLPVGLGYAVCLCGLVLAGAGFTGVPEHALWATPPTIGLFCVWCVLVARSLDSEGAAP